MNNYLSPAELLASYSAAGVRKMERSAASLLLLGALAGAIIAIAAAATNTAVYGISDTWTVRTICGLLFPSVWGWSSSPVRSCSPETACSPSLCWRKRGDRRS